MAKGRQKKPVLTVVKAPVTHKDKSVNLEPPSHLDIVALEEWDRILPLIRERMPLTSADGATLAIYCTAFSLAQKAAEHIAEHGFLLETPDQLDDEGGVLKPGTWKANPAQGALAKANATMLRVLALFGCDPSSRARIGIEEEKVDRFAEFISNKARKSQ